jgi:hypothetical protein
VEELPTDWDLLLLNMYCHGDRCSLNDGPPISAHLHRVHFFMSGAAYCLSPRSAQQILSTLPCDASQGVVCTVAIDSYMSQLAGAGKLVAYRASTLPVGIPQDNKHKHEMVQ